MELLPLVLAAPLLAWMAYSDLRFMRIPNWLVLGIVVIFVVCLPVLPMASVTSRVIAAACVLGIGFVTFAAGLFGGGDVKVLSALMLLIPPGTRVEFALLFSVAMLLGIAVVLTMRLAPAAARSGWVGVRAKGMFPMGISISLAGLMHPVMVSALAG
ncbi:A24 family peptidase [Tropicimonas isoalkanivorans]|uniref:Prepilin peptidase CpaA n=1 Tax=Tropicimonas isoalkanivorans TaxID=441112 RepID=A0A1I1G8E3_9RHOB|nr:prepilin peptidase [Tropicimonas isoalkanivorans]SFC07636.1 prepilin peptidase CpaA [Tropicimonas isoalkanivorans]